MLHANGKSSSSNLQGIPWDRLPLERSQYRKDRMRQYENYTNVIKETLKRYQALNDFLEHGAIHACCHCCVREHESKRCRVCAPCDCSPRYSRQAAAACQILSHSVAFAEVPECLDLPNQHQLFPFERNLGFLQTSIVHFQLRNLLYATAGHIVYAMHHNCIKQYNTITEEKKTIMDLSGQTRTPFNLGQVYVSTMCAAHGLVAAGAPQGASAIRLSVWMQLVCQGCQSPDAHSLCNTGTVWRCRLHHRVQSSQQDTGPMGATVRISIPTCVYRRLHGGGCYSDQWGRPCVVPQGGR